MLPERRELLSVFSHPEALAAAVEKCHESGFEIKNVYLPTPDHELVKSLLPSKSPIRFATFSGGVLGLVGGLALALLSSLVWNIIVSGKPVTSLIPFLVVGFEFTILIGALGTFLALLIIAKLPYRRFPDKGYRKEFSNDRYGLWLCCYRENEMEIRSLLEHTGAERIEDISEVSPKEGSHGSG